MGSDHPIRIIFFGNPLRGDDGFAPAVYRQLAGESELAIPTGERIAMIPPYGEHQSIASAPELIAFPRSPIDSLDLFAGDFRFVVVDAIRCFSGEPGRLHILSAQQLGVEPEWDIHHLSPGALFALIESIHGELPPIRMLVAEVQTGSLFTPGLSAELRKSVDRACALLQHPESLFEDHTASG